MVFLENIENNGSASLAYLFWMLENILKACADDFGDSFQGVVKTSYVSGLINQVEHDFLNNKTSGVRKLRNVFAHANLSKFNIKFSGDELIYPLTENENCRLLYQRISKVIFNIMLKAAVSRLSVDFSINVDKEIKGLGYSIVELSPEEVLLGKGIDPSMLSGWDDLSESERYRHAENAQDVNMVVHFISRVQHKIE
ncbi:hypothetical protein [Halomonas sp. GD1P12]|uniref:hypothetical protein n=1 Tax=Halomonas sp. GD1P12 TaxID=2982691 RepID=UPI0021E4791E|nr:hypothetical protein [Halomonas sp. GD1P12]UYF99035.1 hypothetical protein OCT39_12440 [Halomonas sp. GD1P12]